MQVRRLGAQDVDRAANVLSAAFARDAFVRWNFEDRVDELLPVAFRLTTKLMTERNSAFGVFLDAELLGVALYQAPGKDFKLSSAIAEGAGLLYRARSRTTLRMLHGFGESERFKRECMGEQPYFYLDTLGIHPSHAGRGAGSELLRRSLALVRGSGTEPCFLISQPANLGFYERRGFRSIRQRLIPKVEVTFHGMLEQRQPV
jgi:ribosomal protein S18 acetylase RimI-like enzyme